MNDTAMPAALQLTGLKRHFIQGPKRLDILKGIDLSVASGELVALVGASGSGKSTLLQTAGLLDVADEGTIHIDGQNVSAMKDDARTKVRLRKLGFVYQFHHLMPDFSALENVQMVLRIRGEKNRASAEAAKNILEEIGLGERLDHPPSRLSGGEQQRVAIARALVGNPRLLLADEPTGNLDEATAAQIFKLFVSMVRNRGLAAVIATHDHDLAKQADRILVLKEGYLKEA